MVGSQFLKRAGVVVALAATVGMVGGIGAAQARGSVRIGIGVPFGGYYAPGYYGYAPPPVYYAPPPPVVYAPPPVVYAPTGAPLAATPASDAYVSANGQTCREYQTTVNIGGAPQASYGTACLQPDGTWRIVQ